MQNAYAAVSNADFADMKEQLEALSAQNRALDSENVRLQELVAACAVEKQDMLLRHEKAAETFARTIESMAGRKRARSSTPPPAAPSSSRSEQERQAGIDRYVEGILELKAAEHARVLADLRQEHKRETDKLRARVDAPVNEFRESKRFHIREAELKAEVEKVRGALEAERARAKSMEFAQVDRMDEKREIRDLKQRCADRDHLVREIALLNEEKDRRNEPYRDMQAAELLGMIDVLKEKHATVVIGMFDGTDAMRKERDAAVGELKKVALEAKKYKECLEGRFGIVSEAGEAVASAGGKKQGKPSKSTMCTPCTKTHTAKLEMLTAKHVTEVEKLQQTVKRLTAKLDAKLEAHVLAQRFRDRETELKQRIETLEQELGRTARELREKRINLDTHMASTLRHKAVAKELAHLKEQYEAAKARIAEMDTSIMQQSVPADLAKRHHAQILRAKRMYNLSRERALQLASRIDAEQLRARAAALFEEELLYAYRSLRAEYNRDVGRVPETKRPKRPRAVGVDEYGDGDWMDGVSEGEPGM